jgi:hypothetical protein
MSVGDVVNGILEVPVGGIVYMKPTSNVSWIIQNIILGEVLIPGGSITLYFVRDSDKSLIEYATYSAGSLDIFINNLILHSTQAYYFGIKNNTNQSLDLTYDGIVSNDGTNGAIVVNGFTSVSTNGEFNITPSSGIEWQINSIFSNGGISASWLNSNGNFIETAPGTFSCMQGLRLGVNNSNPIEIINNETITKLIGFIGIRTK